MTENKKILVDLKPALDGFAGIPQETRLLFAALRKIRGVEADGLIQHGSRTLRGGLGPKSGRWSTARRTLELSKLIVSLSEEPYEGFWARLRDQVGRYFAVNELQWRASLAVPLRLRRFDSKNFNDFVWRTFFDKTLSPTEMSLVADASFRIARSARIHLEKAGLRSIGVRERATYPVLDTKGYDFFVAQNPFPGRVHKRTRMLVRYHDAVPLLMPHTINDKAYHQASHFHALRSNVQSGAEFVCISNATRKDLLHVFPEVADRAHMIHDMVSNAYFEEQSTREQIPQILRTRTARIPGQPQVSLKTLGRMKPHTPYLLMVSTIEPRKNHLKLVGAWERLRYAGHGDLKLVIVGALGWEQGPVLNAFRPWIKQGELYHLQSVPAAELRVLYRHAAAVVCPSLAEGFDYSGIEAMRCGGPVVASDIGVHREIYGDAAVYFSPYSVAAGADAIASVISPDAAPLRESLVAAGREVSARYLPERLLPQWEKLLGKMPLSAE